MLSFMILQVSPIFILLSLQFGNSFSDRYYKGGAIINQQTCDDESVNFLRCLATAAKTPADSFIADFRARQVDLFDLSPNSWEWYNDVRMSDTKPYFATLVQPKQMWPGGLMFTKGVLPAADNSLSRSGAADIRQLNVTFSLVPAGVVIPENGADNSQNHDEAVVFTRRPNLIFQDNPTRPVQLGRYGSDFSRLAITITVQRPSRDKLTFFIGTRMRYEQITGPRKEDRHRLSLGGGYYWPESSKCSFLVPNSATPVDLKISILMSHNWSNWEVLIGGFGGLETCKLVLPSEAYFNFFKGDASKMHVGIHGAWYHPGAVSYYQPEIPYASLNVTEFSLAKATSHVTIKAQDFTFGEKVGYFRTEFDPHKQNLLKQFTAPFSTENWRVYGAVSPGNDNQTPNQVRLVQGSVSYGALITKMPLPALIFEKSFNWRQTTAFRFDANCLQNRINLYFAQSKHLPIFTDQRSFSNSLAERQQLPFRLGVLVSRSDDQAINSHDRSQAPIFAAFIVERPSESEKSIEICNNSQILLGNNFMLTISLEKLEDEFQAKIEWWSVESGQGRSSLICRKVFNFADDFVDSLRNSLTRYHAAIVASSLPTVGTNGNNNSSIELVRHSFFTTSQVLVTSSNFVPSGPMFSYKPSISNFEVQICDSNFANGPRCFLDCATLFDVSLPPVWYKQRSNAKFDDSIELVELSRLRGLTRVPTWYLDEKSTGDILTCIVTNDYGTAKRTFKIMAASPDSKTVAQTFEDGDEDEGLKVWQIAMLIMASLIVVLILAITIGYVIAVLRGKKLPIRLIRKKKKASNYQGARNEESNNNRDESNSIPTSSFTMLNTNSMLTNNEIAPRNDTNNVKFYNPVLTSTPVVGYRRYHQSNIVI